MRNNLVLAPVAQRREPEVPVEARLIGRVDARRFVERLRLVAKLIGGPVHAVVGALEFDLVAAARHHGEEAVLVGDAKWLERLDGLHGQRVRGEMECRSSPRWCRSAIHVRNAARTTGWRTVGGCDRWQLMIRWTVAFGATASLLPRLVVAKIEIGYRR